MAFDYRFGEFLLWLLAAVVLAVWLSIKEK